MGSTEQCHQNYLEIMLHSTVSHQVHFPRSFTINRKRTKIAYAPDLALKMLLHMDSLHANNKVQRIQTKNQQISDLCQKKSKGLTIVFVS